MMIENIQDFYDLNNKPLSEISEYLENFDLNIKFVNLFKKIFQAIQAKIHDPSKWGIIDILIPYFPRQLNPLLFLSIILNKENYLPEIQEVIEKKLNNFEDMEFFSEYHKIINLLKEKSDLQTLSGTIIIPISLATFRSKNLDTSIQYTVSGHILNPSESIISDVKIIRNFCETNKKEIFKKYWSSKDYSDLQRIYETIEKNVEFDQEEITKMAEKINKSVEELLGITYFNTSNILEDICKHPSVGRKYKNIILCFDELNHWWVGANHELLHYLHSFYEKMIDISHELMDDNGIQIEKNNVFTIFTHQKDIFIGDKGIILRNKLNNVFMY